MLRCIVPRRSDAKQRMIEGAARLQAERGIEGTAFAAVLQRSGAPRGSIYHHFPGGKTQLVSESTAFAAASMTEFLRRTLAEHGPRGAIDVLVDFWEQRLTDSGFAAGCPVAAAALYAEAPAAAREAAASGFGEWQALLADAFRSASPAITPARAARAAAFVIAAMEGALLLCRAERSAAPLRQVGTELHDYVDELISRTTEAKRR